MAKKRQRLAALTAAALGGSSARAVTGGDNVDGDPTETNSAVEDHGIHDNRRDKKLDTFSSRRARDHDADVKSDTSQHRSIESIVVSDEIHAAGDGDNAHEATHHVADDLRTSTTFPEHFLHRVRVDDNFNDDSENGRDSQRRQRPLSAGADPSARDIPHTLPETNIRSTDAGGGSGVGVNGEIGWMHQLGGDEVKTGDLSNASGSQDLSLYCTHGGGDVSIATPRLHSPQQHQLSDIVPAGASPPADNPHGDRRGDAADEEHETLWRASLSGTKRRDRSTIIGAPRRDQADPVAPGSNVPGAIDERDSEGNFFLSRQQSGWPSAPANAFAEFNAPKGVSIGVGDGNTEHYGATTPTAGRLEKRHLFKSSSLSSSIGNNCRVSAEAVATMLLCDLNFAEDKALSASLDVVRHRHQIEHRQHRDGGRVQQRRHAQKLGKTQFASVQSLPDLPYGFTDIGKRVNVAGNIGQTRL